MRSLALSKDAYLTMELVDMRHFFATHADRLIVFQLPSFGRADHRSAWNVIGEEGVLFPPDL